MPLKLWDITCKINACSAEFSKHGPKNNLGMAFTYSLELRTKTLSIH